MKKITILIVFISCVGCYKTSNELSLVSFKSYETELDIFSFGLGFDGGCNIEINKNGNNVNIKVTFNEVGEFLDPAIEGHYDIKNDTIYLGWKYNQKKGEESNWAYYDTRTIIWEYDFIVDTTYTFLFLSDSTNCTIVNGNSQ